MTESGKKSRPKMTKEDRKAKYTKLARRRASLGAGRTSICFRCRRRGHTVANCPGSAVASCCFKCGSTEHNLARCPERRPGADDFNSLPFASCFICKESGHLASHCPSNSRGIYIKGGCCKECGSIQHRVTDCPERREKPRKQGPATAESEDFALDGDDNLLDHEEPPGHHTAPEKKDSKLDAKGRRRVVTF